MARSDRQSEDRCDWEPPFDAEEIAEHDRNLEVTSEASVANNQVGEAVVLNACSDFEVKKRALARSRPSSLAGRRSLELSRS